MKPHLVSILSQTLTICYNSILKILTVQCGLQAGYSPEFQPLLTLPIYQNLDKLRIACKPDIMQIYHMGFSHGIDT